MPIYIPNTFDSVGEAVVDGAGGGFILDLFPTDIQAAHSLRKVRSSYTGPCIQVRRDSDNALQDIGFDSATNYVDTAAIASFCTGTTGYVYIIYDQSGNSRHGVAAGASWEGLIYQSGAVITRNGFPAFARTSGNGTRYVFNSYATLPTNTVYSIFTAHSWNSTGAIMALYGNNSDNLWLANNGAIIAGIGSITGTYFGFNGAYVGNNLSRDDIYEVLLSNKSVILTAIGLIGTWMTQNQGLGLGYGSSGNNSYGYWQESLIWSQNLTNDRVTIENNMNEAWQSFIPYTYEMQEFDSAGTWTKPANCLLAEVVIIGAGGGGASGSKQPAGSASQGGSAGGSGSVVYATISGASLGATETITIGVAGNGGASVSSNSTNGTSGGGGGTTSFGSHVRLAGATGAAYNIQGNAKGQWDALTLPSGCPGFTPGQMGRSSTVSGSGTPSAGGVQTSYSQDVMGLSPGGGSITSGGSIGVGGNGTRNYNRNGTLNTAANRANASTGLKSDNGVSNYCDNVSVGPIMWGAQNLGTMHYGASGAGGSASVGNVNGGEAGNSGDYGAGGAGGGACQNGGTHVSGAGAAGGRACVKVLAVCYPS
jgi:hypothetical protein